MRGLNKVGKRSYCSYFSYFSYFPAVGARQVEAQVSDARAKGAKVLCGGARAEAGGLIFEPTVLADVTRDMSCFADETFGPLCPIVAFETDAEAISIANDTRVPPSLATRALPRARLGARPTGRATSAERRIAMPPKGPPTRRQIAANHTRGLVRRAPGQEIGRPCCTCTVYALSTTWRRTQDSVLPEAARLQKQVTGPGARPPPWKRDRQGVQYLYLYALSITWRRTQDSVLPEATRLQKTSPRPASPPASLGKR